MISACQVFDVRPVPAQRDQLAPHLVRLSGDWALWRTVCLRGAGFPVSLLDELGAPALASAADLVNSSTGDVSTNRAGYAAEFAAEVRRQSSALYRIAGLPLLREAIAWQNRNALENGIEVLLRRGPGTGKRNAQRRRHEALVASYLQRYCAKNDTIGFFGPVGWSWIDDEAGLRVTPAAPGQMIAARVTYLEGWAVRAILAHHDVALRPWLVPRRIPLMSVDGTLLRLPLGPPPATHGGRGGGAASLRRNQGRQRDRRDGARRSRLRGGRGGAGLRADGTAGRPALAGLADRRRTAGHPARALGACTAGPGHR